MSDPRSGRRGSRRSPLAAGPSEATPRQGSGRVGQSLLRGAAQGVLAVALATLVLAIAGLVIAFAASLLVGS